MKSTVEITCEGQPLSLSVEIHVRDCHYLLKSTVEIIMLKSVVETVWQDQLLRLELEIIYRGQMMRLSVEIDGTIEMIL